MIEAVKSTGASSFLNALDSVSGAKGADKAADPNSFAAVLGNMATQAVDNLKYAEHASFEGIKGTMSTREVVDAVMQAEQSLQTAMAFRDKIVSAYLDISKMQI